MNFIIKSLFPVLLIFLVTSCKDTVNIGGTEVDEELFLKKQAIDLALVNGDLYSETLVKEVGKNGLLLVQHDEWPMEIDIIYNIWRDNNNKIKLISEAPLHANKGLNVLFENYYDENDKAFSFVKTVEYFNIKCSYDPIYAKEVNYFDENHELESQLNLILNEAKEELNPELCENENPPELQYVMNENLQATLDRINKGK